ncbi:SRPBCC domain-containing protein [Nonomuraea sp. MCN248]|uniref:SRPBCC domain-containing protein n=1 Tax=Nonomuraea corallina TaxID=2989783 RepID=A0ABT4SGC3_9ACTN|nr:SRPBCC domain-containing protein [Nonomuraea corallina]MDA0636237.1 SRPBCC domain-containing protein [Nonomuraea corallina]
MGHEFELPQEAMVEATPEEVWAAISTGPGIDSWFMGTSEVTGGVIRTAFGGGAMEPSRVTVAREPHRFTHVSDTGADGRFVAYEFLIEARDRGSTTVRMVTSGFLPGDDWADEYDAMSGGLALFFATLVEYLTHFRGRHATPVAEFGPPVSDWPRAWEILYGELGASFPGDKVRLDVPGLPTIEGAVYHRGDQTLGVRAPDALYRFMQGFHGPMIASHQVFGDAQGQGPAWRAWLERLYS